MFMDVVSKNENRVHELEVQTLSWSRVESSEHQFNQTHRSEELRKSTKLNTMFKIVLISVLIVAASAMPYDILRAARSPHGPHGGIGFSGSQAQSFSGGYGGGYGGYPVGYGGYGGYGGYPIGGYGGYPIGGYGGYPGYGGVGTGGAYSSANSFGVGVGFRK
ncbi:glycine-rich cell wall structural protein-like [Diprion similis]|uniref:glycine-rich cell wall structural protein-like n=1 Tax=Diprion similis TaxID=362088 RepID=UPI001EF8930E|nr:glycine-rich cell wall structural protein-like [Diprion similis]